MFFTRPICRNIFVDHIREGSLDVFESHIWRRAGFGEPQLEMLMYWSVLFEETSMFSRAIFVNVNLILCIIWIQFCVCELRLETYIFSRATFQEMNALADLMWR
jgi:hypothetical protein